MLYAYHGPKKQVWDGGLTVCTIVLVPEALAAPSTSHIEYVSPLALPPDSCCLMGRTCFREHPLRMRIVNVLSVLERGTYSSLTSGITLEFLRNEHLVMKRGGYFLGPNPSNQCRACCTHLCSVALPLSPCVCCCVLSTLRGDERANDQFPLSLILSPLAVAQICSAEGLFCLSPLRTPAVRRSGDSTVPKINQCFGRRADK